MAVLFLNYVFYIFFVFSCFLFFVKRCFYVFFFFLGVGAEFYSNGCTIMGFVWFCVLRVSVFSKVFTDVLGIMFLFLFQEVSFFLSGDKVGLWA